LFSIAFISLDKGIQLYKTDINRFIPVKMYANISKWCKWCKSMKIYYNGVNGVNGVNL